MYAKVTFTHLNEHFKAGDPYPADHPMVVARPDLFVTRPPKAVTADKAKAPAEASKEK